MVGELECYGPHAWAYLDVKPGITGRWQTDGRNHIRYPERAELDADYVENWSLRQRRHDPAEDGAAGAAPTRLALTPPAGSPPSVGAADG